MQAFEKNITTPTIWAAEPDVFVSVYVSQAYAQVRMVPAIRSC